MPSRPLPRRHRRHVTPVCRRRSIVRLLHTSVMHHLAPVEDLLGLPIEQESYTQGGGSSPYVLYPARLVVPSLLPHIGSRHPYLVEPPKSFANASNGGKVGKSQIKSFARNNKKPLSSTRCRPLGSSAAVLRPSRARHWLLKIFCH